MDSFDLSTEVSTDAMDVCADVSTDESTDVPTETDMYFLGVRIQQGKATTRADRTEVQWVPRGNLQSGDDVQAGRSVRAGQGEGGQVLPAGPRERLREGDVQSRQDARAGPGRA